MLGVSIENDFSIAQHIQRLVTASVQTVYALRVLRTRGLDDDALQHIYRATVVARLTYAASAWSGLTKAPDNLDDLDQRRYHCATPPRHRLWSHLIGLCGHASWFLMTNQRTAFAVCICCATYAHTARSVYVLKFVLLFLFTF